MRSMSHVMALILAAAAWPAAAVAAEPQLAERFMTLTRSSTWEKTGETPVAFATFHPQGMVKVGNDFFVSAVEVTTQPKRFDAPRDGHDRDTGAGIGHLFKFGPDGRLRGEVTLGDGPIYHPGGIDYDGRFIWVPAAEYRPDSHSIIYRVDPETLTAEEMFRFDDHIGGLVHDTDTDTLHGVSWGSRRFYAWPLGADGRPTNAGADPATLRVMNPAQYIDYQDCHYAGASRMLCSGLNVYKTSPDAQPFRLGGIELVDLKTGAPVWQAPLSLWAPSGLPMTQNPSFVEPTANGLRAYFMPDDDHSTLFTYETK
ncbi:DUF6454 family protein [Aurantimonas sp. MSK8Z-1]|uniref:DUF6454 family protein n=1 Tax=Mangrovibrevibacter kandeliae TaxID=2968473 RepID=UPI0021197BAB|nr:DUF6454 family protein [Aurantimonas sp. MSK8Z-1]MCW4115303.1 DUF6454 family protein [Aurantimonas sp. MSK8Z-1]